MKKADIPSFIKRMRKLINQSDLLQAKLEINLLLIVASIGMVVYLPIRWVLLGLVGVSIVLDWAISLRLIFFSEEEE